MDGCERILRDEFKDYPERALYMIGKVDEAKDKAKANPPASPRKPVAQPEPEVERVADAHES